MSPTAQSGGMPADRNEKSGRFERTYTPDVLLAAINSLGGYATTREIADEIEASQSITRRRLRELADEGRVERRGAGNTFLWSETDD